MYAQSTFEVLSGEGEATSCNWQGSLARLFHVCRDLTASMNADIRASLLPRPFCARSNIDKHEAFGNIKQDLRSLMVSYPLDIQFPFEGVPTIGGGIWRASELYEDHATDALLKLRFRAGTMDLPVHSHDHSDRVIFVTEGSGLFALAGVSGTVESMKSISVKAGDAIVFSRGTLHTFQVPSVDLVLLSYHSPFIDLDDPRQYTIAKIGDGGRL